MSLTKVSYAMINGSPASVLDYGAIGDGATNSTSAIQAALNNNSVVYLPYGTYLTNATLTIPANVTLFGPGTIHYTGNYHAIDVLGSSVTIDGITLYGEYPSVYESGSVGIYCNQTTFNPTLNIITTTILSLQI